MLWWGRESFPLRNYKHCSAVFPRQVLVFETSKAIGFHLSGWCTFSLWKLSRPSLSLIFWCFVVTCLGVRVFFHLSCRALIPFHCRVSYPLVFRNVLTLLLWWLPSLSLFSFASPATLVLNLWDGPPNFLIFSFLCFSDFFFYLLRDIHSIF